MRHLLPFFACLLLSLAGRAQLGIGTGEQLFIQNGTIFSVDSLVLIPGVNTTISTNALTHTYTPAPGVIPSTNSIARVYKWATPITYTGSLGIIYSDAELAGNTENLLQIAYYNTPAWTTTAASTVNTTTNYVAYPAVGITFGTTTATTLGITLPIIFDAFTATLNDQYVLLNWKMGDIENLTGFEVEFSDDGNSWLKAGTVSAAPAQMDFSYRHNDLLFSLRYYRLAALSATGRRSYSRIATVRNGDAGTGLSVVRNGSYSTMLYFRGTAPSSLQVYDMKGQLMMRKAVNQQQVEITGLKPGIYVIQYITEGQRVARRIQF
jgi:hypothetical protein